MKQSIIYERNYEQYFNESGNHGQVFFASQKSREDNIERILAKECIQTRGGYLLFDQETMTLSNINTSGYATLGGSYYTKEEMDANSEYKKRVFIDIMPPSPVPKGLHNLLTEAGFKEVKEQK